MRSDRRGSWYLLTGAVLGVVFGLVYSWVISPVQYVNAPPYALRADFKDEYRVLVASAYLYSSDLVRAEDRLAQLKDDNTAQSLAKQAQQALAEGRAEEDVRALGLLAMALGRGVTPPAIQGDPVQDNLDTTPSETGESTPVFLEPSETGISSPVPIQSLETPATSPQPTAAVQPAPLAPASTATQGSELFLRDTTLVCNPGQGLPLIQVVILDAANQPVPGIKLAVTWDSGDDSFYTGLQPELGEGYADFQMTPGVVYSLRPVAGGQPANDITAAECLAEDETRYWGSWMFTYIQP